MSARNGAEDVVSLIAIRESELSVDEVRTAVEGDAVGGIALFVGTIRDYDHDHDVTGLSYTAHPSAEAELRRVAAAIAEKFPVLGVALSSPTRDPVSLRLYAELVLRPLIAATAGVAAVEVIGGSQAEYEILVDPARLQGLGIGNVAAAEPGRRAKFG